MEELYSVHPLDLDKVVVVAHLKCKILEVLVSYCQELLQTHESYREFTMSEKVWVQWNN